MITTAAAMLGLAAGGLGTSALVQYGPAPTRLIWWLLLGADLAAAVGVLAMPETAPARPGVLGSLRLPRPAPRHGGDPGGDPDSSGGRLPRRHRSSRRRVRHRHAGAFRTVSALVGPGQRASLIAAYFIVS